MPNEDYLFSLTGWVNELNASKKHQYGSCMEPDLGYLMLFSPEYFLYNSDDTHVSLQDQDISPETDSEGSSKGSVFSS